jgi:Fe-S-cluster-containing dehydrogenase component
VSKHYLLQDAEQCIGCGCCEVSCKAAHDLGPGPALCSNQQVGPVMVDGLPKIRFVFVACFHCEEPWCLNACPTGAVKKRARDGIVYIDAALCVGCLSCLTACPWDACQWDPETRKAVKCDFCMDRVDAGEDPACVTRCLTSCLSFGDAKNAPEGRRRQYAEQLAAADLGRPRP